MEIIKMPTAEAQLILSCKATGTAEVKKFNKAVMDLDTACKKLIGDIDKMDLKMKNLKFPQMNNSGFPFGGSSGIPGSGKIGQWRDYEKEIKQKTEEMRQAIARTNQEAMQTLPNVTKGFDKFAAGAKIASKGTEELNFKMIAAKAAGRAFGFELGEGTAKMAKLGIVAAGVAAGMKVFKALLENTNKDIRDSIYWMGQAVNYDLDKLDSEKSLSRELKNTFETLRTLNEKENLSSSDRLKIQNIVNETRESFRQYGIVLDIVSGKIKNLNEAEIQFSEKAKQAEINRLRNAIASLKSQNEQLLYQSEGGDLVRTRSERIRNLFGNQFKMEGLERGVYETLNFMLGDKLAKESDEAAQKRLKNLDEIAKLQEQLRKIEAINPTKNINDREEARQADIIAKQKEEVEKLTNSFKDQMKAMQDKIKIQDLINRGLSAEAKKLETITDLMKKFPGFSKDQINQLYKESLKLDGLISQQKEKESAERNAAIAKREQERTAERLSRQAEQERTARAAITRELAEAGRMFKQMSGMAIESNSIQGIMLQSRKMFLPEIDLKSLQAGNQSPIRAGNQQSAMKQQIHTLENKLERVISLLEAGNNNTTEIRTEVSKIQTTTY